MPILSILAVWITKQVYETVYESAESSKVFPRYLFKSGLPSDIRLLRDKSSSVESENCHQASDPYSDFRVFFPK
jgi:hypothetical protein